ncbi:hypothetical protein N9Z70_07570 [Mariniblastus sp.]|nr:hypothetical protein [Mariniblastus sp.]
MTRGRSSSAPKYRLHKATGQARVTIRGTTFYLGKHGSEQSHQKYKQLLADEWNPCSSSQTPPLKSAAVPVTVTDLAVEYAKFVTRKFGDDSNEWKQVRLVLKSIRESYGHLLANEFGPVRLENYRQTLVARGLSRAVIKRKSNYVKKMYQNAVRYELIPVELWQSLCALGPVEMQDTPRRKIGPADLDIVKATQLELTPVLRDMVEVHRLIGARPSEVCNIRPCDIDRTNEIWVYTPAMTCPLRTSPQQNLGFC